MYAQKLLNAIAIIRRMPEKHRIAGMMYLRATDVAKRWENSISTGTLANWRSQRKGPPFVRFGSKVLYPIAELEAWEAATMVASASNDNQPK